MEVMGLQRRFFSEQVSDVVQQAVWTIGGSGRVNLGDGSDIAPVAMIRRRRKGGDTRILLSHKQTGRARQQVSMLRVTIGHPSNLSLPDDRSEEDCPGLRGLLVRK